jgi:hypothetical protein
MRIHENRPNLSKTGLKNKSTIQILKVWIRKSGFASPPAWIRQSWYKTNLFWVRIHDHDTKRIHGFAKWIHVFTNLLYDSRILTKILEEINRFNSKTDHVWRCTFILAEVRLFFKIFFSHFQQYLFCGFLDKIYFYLNQWKKFYFGLIFFLQAGHNNIILLIVTIFSEI